MKSKPTHELSVTMNTSFDYLKMEEANNYYLQRR